MYVYIQLEESVSHQPVFRDLRWIPPEEKTRPRWRCYIQDWTHSLILTSNHTHTNTQDLMNMCECKCNHVSCIKTNQTTNQLTNRWPGCGCSYVWMPAGPELQATTTGDWGRERAPERWSAETVQGPHPPAGGSREAQMSVCREFII